MKETGKVLVIVGLVILVLGLVFWLGGSRIKSLGALTKWFGHLPGDIHIRKPNFSFYMPLASMILISAVLSFLIWLFQKLFR